MQAVSYRCDSGLICSAVSANSFQLLGIRRKNLLNQQSLWRERILPDDRDLLLTRLKFAHASETVSAVHKLLDDDSKKISVVHILGKLQKGSGDAVRGLIIPLTKELDYTKVDATIISQFTHKLGNHFQLISLLVGSLTEDALNAGEINEIRLAVERAGELTRAFSGFSQHPVFCSGINLGEIIESAVRLFDSICDEKGIHLHCAIKDFINEAVITADAVLLEHAFTMLLQNALDAVDKGGRISVTGERSSDRLRQRSAARILIADNGRGMDAKMIIKAVDPFVSSRQDRDGLGLSTALRIVEMHGGFLTISSNGKIGTEIEILLPTDSATSPL
jgi:signal transduction histidine kinase